MRESKTRASGLLEDAGYQFDDRVQAIAFDLAVSERLLRFDTEREVDKLKTLSTIIMGDKLSFGISQTSSGNNSEIPTY